MELTNPPAIGVVRRGMFDNDTATRLFEKTVAVVESILDDANASDSDRLSAAALVTDWLGLDSKNLLAFESGSDDLDANIKKRKFYHL